MSSWKVAHVDGANSVSAVSCPSVLLCVAVENAGNSVVSSDPAGGSSAWTVHQSDDESYYECEHYGPYPCPPPPLVGVSCPSVSLCVAVDDAGWAIGSTAPTTPGAWSDSFGAPGRQLPRGLVRLGIAVRRDVSIGRRLWRVGWLQWQFRHLLQRIGGHMESSGCGWTISLEVHDDLSKRSGWCVVPIGAALLRIR
jgi:hypothetical protein